MRHVGHRWDGALCQLCGISIANLPDYYFYDEENRSRIVAIGEAAIAPIRDRFVQAGEDCCTMCDMLVALGKSGLHALHSTMTHKSLRVRLFSVDAIAKHADDIFLPSLCAAVYDSDDLVAWWAVRGLRKLRNPIAFDALCHAIGRKAGEAAKALGELGDPRAIELLCRALRPYVDATTLKGLMRATAVGPELSLIEGIAEALGCLRAESALDLLKSLEALMGPEIRAIEFAQESSSSWGSALRSIDTAIRQIEMCKCHTKGLPNRVPSRTDELPRGSSSG